ncbi:MAG: phenylalanine--tRNA ligase subunit alpha, partial [Geopsychrobacter sp.]|nr:phenylalanine--tRNA ligase subunit alpha [Geopsychrobacter sp.]
MKDRLQNLEKDALAAIASAETTAALQDIRVAYLGKKGAVTDIMKGMRDLSAEQRPVIGALVNSMKANLESAFSDHGAVLQKSAVAERIASEKIDVTLPGRQSFSGSKHPVTLVTEEIVEIFSRLGFAVEEGPEIEQDFYNFEALNIPKDHPARDMQDTFYIDDEVVLRTHTSPV